MVYKLASKWLYVFCEWLLLCLKYSGRGLELINFAMEAFNAFPSATVPITVKIFKFRTHFYFTTLNCKYLHTCIHVDHMHRHLKLVEITQQILIISTHTYAYTHTTKLITRIHKFAPSRRHFLVINQTGMNCISVAADNLWLTLSALKYIY